MLGFVSGGTELIVESRVGLLAALPSVFTTLSMKILEDSFVPMSLIATSSHYLLPTMRRPISCRADEETR